MSVSGDKKNIFTTIGSYSSFSKNDGKIPKSRSTYPSVNNKKDVIPFLIDTLKVTVGSEAVKLVVGELLTKFLDKTEKSSKTILKKQFTDSNSDKQVSNEFKTSGYRVKASKVDINKKFRNKTTSVTYPLYKNDVNSSFENSMHEAIRLEPTEISYENTIKVSYDKVSDDFIFKSAKSDYLTKDFVNDYIDKTSIINKKEIHTNVMNIIFGTTSKTEKKTVSEIASELEVDKILSQVIDGSDSFDISQNELDALYKAAEDIANGVSKQDLGCGIMDTSLSIVDLTNLIAQISGSTNSFAVANALENTLENNTNIDPDIYAENKEIIKDNFFKKIINSFVLTLSKALTTAPQIRALIAITGAFKGKSDLLDGKVSDTIKNVKSFTDCIIKELIKQISEFIYKKVLALLKELIKPILKNIAKEKIKLYSRLNKSLAKPVPT